MKLKFWGRHFWISVNIALFVFLSNKTLNVYDIQKQDYISQPLLQLGVTCAQVLADGIEGCVVLEHLVTHS